jgi:hypothetical protein
MAVLMHVFLSSVCDSTVSYPEIDQVSERSPGCTVSVAAPQLRRRTDSQQGREISQLVVYTMKAQSEHMKTGLGEEADRYDVR